MEKEKRQEMARVWQDRAKKRIRKNRQYRTENLKKEIEESEFMIDKFRLVKGLIKDAMDKGMIEIEGMDTPYHPEILDQSMNLSKLEQEELEKEVESKKAELRRLEIEVIVDCQKLIVFEKDLKELN